MKRYLFIGIIFLHSAAYCQQRYYFDSKAVASGNGSKQNPFRSLKSFAQLSLYAGDSVFFKGGGQLGGTVWADSIHGTRDRQIVFTSYGKGNATIDGKNDEAFVIRGSSYFQIIKINLRGSGRKNGNTTDGLRMVSCHHGVASDLDISGFQKAGMMIYNCKGMEVKNVSSHENGSVGILVEGDYQKRYSNSIHIVNCRANNNPGDPTNLTNHSGNGILVGNCKNVLIEYCSATKNGWDMPRKGNGPVGIWAYEADSVVIQHCISYRNKTAKGAADGGGFDLDGGVTNSVIQYCLSYENWGSGYGIFQYGGAGRWFNNTVRYCVSINDGLKTDFASGMLIWNGDNDSSIFSSLHAYQNVFYNDRKYAFCFLDQSLHSKFFLFNNIFIAADSSDIFHGTDSSATDIFLGNVWMTKNGGFRQSGFDNLASWSQTTGFEQREGRCAGNSFQRRLFTFPASIRVTDPHSLKTNRLLGSLCHTNLLQKGIDIARLFGIDPGPTDFFGHAILPNRNPTPGVCAMQ